MTREFWHVGITVSDIDASIAFYRDIVGMTEGETMQSASPQFGQLVNNPGAVIKTVFLTQNGFTLQLLQYLAKGGEKLSIEHNKIGSPHLAIHVTDVKQHYDKLRERGDVNITSPIVTSDRAYMSSFYVTDPDGMPIEFAEIHKP